MRAAFRHPQLYRRQVQVCFSRAYGDYESRDDFRRGGGFRRSRDDYGPGGGFDGFRRGGSDDRRGRFQQKLTPVDWDKVQMKPYTKNFYSPHPDVAKRAGSVRRKLLEEHNINIIGMQPLPSPITTFEEANFPDEILKLIRGNKFPSPTPIQMAGWPVALSGRDMVGVAQTGSGKTLSFLLPGIIHASAQEPVVSGDGPIVLVLAPTRELVTQIAEESRPYLHPAKVSMATVFGGASRYPQEQQLRRGVDIVAACPGRLMDFLSCGTTNLHRVTYLVLDEADRMMDMGFEPQIREILTQVRADRQTLMWSATWPREVQTLAREFCRESPVHIAVGDGELKANPDVKQRVQRVRDSEKLSSLVSILKGGQENGKAVRALVFCDRKRGSDQLARHLQKQSFQAEALHGDKSQSQRDNVMDDFRQGRVNVLVATDVASRGLDIKDLDWVVNYNLPNSVEDYVHRIGRTGRAGREGNSVTFLDETMTPQHRRVADGIDRLIREAEQVRQRQVDKR
eukprot:GHVU01014058.1.p1 GENE.GHVU01014058.1~~GHVU01014058.1.p1  ORF type:complete len:550 (+),score=28.47 GHVU01014058.1:118-1650(+)